MKYDFLKKLSSEEFRRLTTLSRQRSSIWSRFWNQRMVEKKSRGGRSNKLCIEDQFLLALEYLHVNIARIFMLALSYGVSESSAYKTSRWVEDTLIKHPDFSRCPARKFSLAVILVAILF